MRLRITCWLLALSLAAVAIATEGSSPPWGSKPNPGSTIVASGKYSVFQIFRETFSLIGTDADVAAGFTSDSLVVLYELVSEQHFDDTYSRIVASLGAPDSKARVCSRKNDEEPQCHLSAHWTFTNHAGDSIRVWLDERDSACEKTHVWDALFPGREDRFCVRIYNQDLDLRLTRKLRE